MWIRKLDLLVFRNLTGGHIFYGRWKEGRGKKETKTKRMRLLLSAMASFELSERVRGCQGHKSVEPSDSIVLFRAGQRSKYVNIYKKLG